MLKKNATFQPYPNSIHDVVNNKSRIRLNIQKNGTLIAWYWSVLASRQTGSCCVED
jgi:hypothetical protein